MPEDDFSAEYVVLLEFFETLLIFTVRQIETTDVLPAYIERCEKSER